MNLPTCRLTARQFPRNALSRMPAFYMQRWEDLITHDILRSDVRGIRRTRFEIGHDLEPVAEFQAIGAALGFSDVYARRLYNSAIKKLIGLARREL